MPPRWRGPPRDGPYSGRVLRTCCVSPEVGDIERHWRLGAHTPAPGRRELFPRDRGSFIQAARNATSPARKLVVGQWALVPWFASTATLPYLTVNARFEQIAHQASYKLPWARSQRCIIPAESCYAPHRESGRHVPIEPEDVGTRLFASLPEAMALVRLTPEDCFDAGPTV